MFFPIYLDANETFAALVNMGFDEHIAKEASKKHPLNKRNKAINFALQSKPNIQEVIDIKHNKPWEGSDPKTQINIVDEKDNEFVFQNISNKDGNTIQIQGKVQETIDIKPSRAKLPSYPAPSHGQTDDIKKAKTQPFKRLHNTTQATTVLSSSSTPSIKLNDHRHMSEDYKLALQLQQDQLISRTEWKSELKYLLHVEKLYQQQPKNMTFVNSNQCSIEKCKSIERIKSLLMLYNDIMDKTTLMDIIHKQIHENYDTKWILNDYIHIITIHDNGLEEVYIKLNIKCDVNKCNGLKRNQRGRVQNYGAKGR